MGDKAFHFLLGDEGGLLLPPEHMKKTPLLYVASNDGESAESVLALLRRAPHAPVHLVADIHAQSVRTEALPPLSFFDRRKLVERRLEQAFPHTKLRASLSSPTGACRLAGLDETENLGFWRDLLSKAANPPGDLCLLPLELSGLMFELAPHARKGWSLLLVWHRTGGVRQIITRDGNVVFTRLTPLPPDQASPDFVARSLKADIQATRGYLGRFGLAAKAPLALVALLPPSVKESFEKEAPVFDKAVTLTPQEAVQLTHVPLSLKPEETGGELVSLLWIAQKKRRACALVPPKETKRNREAFLHRNGVRLALVVLLLSALQLAWTNVRMTEKKRDINQLQKELVALDREFASLRASLSGTTPPLDRLRLAVEKRRFFGQKKNAPQDMAPQITEALSGRARLLRFHWLPDEIRIDVLLLRETASREELAEGFELLAQTMREKLPEHRVEITRYPFPNLPEETLTPNKDRAPAPVAQFRILEGAAP